MKKMRHWGNMSQCFNLIYRLYHVIASQNDNQSTTFSTVFPLHIEDIIHLELD